MSGCYLPLHAMHPGGPQPLGPINPIFCFRHTLQLTDSRTSGMQGRTVSQLRRRRPCSLVTGLVEYRPFSPAPFTAGVQDTSRRVAVLTRGDSMCGCTSSTMMAGCTSGTSGGRSYLLLTSRLSKGGARVRGLIRIQLGFTKHFGPLSPDAEMLNARMRSVSRANFIEQWQG